MRRGCVSIVIAVRDGASFLADAVASVRAQTHPEVELIVVDDGSVDDTPAVARALAVDRLVTLPSNQGVSSARNIGVALANGEFVSFLDADDGIAPTKIEAQVQYLARNPDRSCVLVHQQLEIEPGVELPEWLVPVMDGSVPLAPATISALVRTSLLYRAGGFDPSYRLAEDTEWLLRVVGAGGPIGTLDDRLHRRRIHGGNASYDLEGTRRALFRALRPLVRPSAAGGPAISVIVPAHEAARFLPEAIASIVAQAGCAPEVIIIDDGSADDSLAVAHTLAEQYPGITVAAQPRAGPGAARNHGILLARAPLLAFLDADDVWMPGKLAAQMKVLQENPAVDVVVGGVVEWADADCPAGVRPRPPQSASTASVAVIRRDAFVRVGPFVADPNAPEWLDWWARAQESGLRATTLPSVLARRRLHGGNHSRQTRMVERNAYAPVLRQSLIRRRGGGPPGANAG